MVRRNQGRYAVAAKMRMGVSPTLLSMGLDNFAYALADDPGLVDTIIGALCRLEHRHPAPAARTWASTLCGRWTTWPIASGPMFSPRVLRQVFMPHMRRVADAIHATGLPWIFHSDGNLMPFLDDLLALGFNGLHPLEPGPMDIEAMKRQIGARSA